MIIMAPPRRYRRGKKRQRRAFLRKPCLCRAGEGRHRAGQRGMLLMADTAGSFPPGLPSPASGTGKRSLRGKGGGAAGPGPLVLRTGRAHHARLRRAGSVQAGKKRGKAACGALRGNSSRSPRPKRHGGNGRTICRRKGRTTKKQPALHDILAGGPPGMPFFATARACRTRGGERRERRAVAKKAGCACRALRDRARSDAASFSGKMRSLARPLCGRAEAMAKACEGCRATARTKGGRKRRGTGEPCRRRAFPTGRRAYAVGGRSVSLSSRAISSGVRRRRRNS